MWGRGAGEGFPQKVSLSRRRCGNTQGKGTLGRGKHKCKGPEVGCAHGLEECRKAGSAGVHHARVKRGMRVEKKGQRGRGWVREAGNDCGF